MLCESRTLHGNLNKREKKEEKTESAKTMNVADSSGAAAAKRYFSNK